MASTVLRDRVVVCLEGQVGERVKIAAVATGLLEAEKKFRCIKGYQEILLLKERLNPSRIQQKEVRTVEVA
jgi:hypothetical protein